jgi:hypothetical protein
MFGILPGLLALHVQAAAGAASVERTCVLYDCASLLHGCKSGLVGGSSQADRLKRNSAMDDSIGGS